jgi:phosphohistidine swiveling domain-containing protein
MKYILNSGSASELGGKAYSLSCLQGGGFNVPAWFAVSPRAFEDSLSNRQREVLRRRNIDEVRALFDDIRICADVFSEIATALAALPHSDGQFAVRSSGAAEDSVTDSFAGQLDSYLRVPVEGIPAKIVAVWRSGFSERVVRYRAASGAPMSSITAPAVVIQEMVNADAAGVAFTADPVSGRRGIVVISAIRGLGTALVSGEKDAEVYEVDRCGTTTRFMSPPSKAGKANPATDRETASTVDTAEVKRVLTDDQVRHIASMARNIARHLGRSQDIEWAIRDRDLYILQARPITTLRDMSDPDAVRNIWDNSNITESYSGITTPLTFSFALAAYEAVYRELAHILKVPERTIAAHDQTFQHMLGLMRGRVYYNLLNWYRILALLPGFKINRQFMEQMMGVKESLPDEVIDSVRAAHWREKVLDSWHLCRMLAAVLRNYVLLDRITDAFYARLDRALREPVPPLADMRADELAGYYRTLMREVLTHWDAPLLNDLFTMVFHGTLRKLSERWIGGGDELANELVRTQGHMISIEPAKCLREMSQIGAAHPELIDLLRERDFAGAISAIRKIPELNHKYDEYLARFGDRCLEELKLESPTLQDDPTPLLSSLAQLMRQADVLRSPNGIVHPSSATEERANKSLSRHALRRVVFRWVLRNTRERIRARENLRFERTRVFGRVRRVFVELGKRLQEIGVIEHARDVFYLQVEEVMGFVSGTAVTTNLKQLVALRKGEFQEFRHQPAPADRFETHGPVYYGNPFQAQDHADEMANSGEERRGLGSGAGRVRGCVVIVSDPHVASPPVGSILVAERTDPGWITLFATAGALIVERGSLLSHSAIVSRELGIPSVVSIPGITKWLRDGDVVEVDGGTGMVRKLRSEAAYA